MPYRTNVIRKLEDESLVRKIAVALKNRFNKKYIQQTYNVTRRELERIIEFHSLDNIN